MRHVTLCFLLKENSVLLAKKKRGFGVGNFNGVGGKLEEGETPDVAATRELYEEIGVMVRPERLSKVAEIEFYFPHKPEWNLFCHTYTVDQWEGEPVETEEMAPQWFSRDNLPFHSMWADDPHWLPKVLAGKKVKARFSFTPDNSVLDSHVDETSSFHCYTDDKQVTHKYHAI